MRPDTVQERGDVLVVAVLARYPTSRRAAPTLRPFSTGVGDARSSAGTCSTIVQLRIAQARVGTQSTTPVTYTAAIRTTRDAASLNRYSQHFAGFEPQQFS